MPLPNEEQVILRNTSHSWAQSNAPVSRFRALRDTEKNNYFFDHDLLAEAAEMGWLGGLISEEHGGSDVGFRAMAGVLEELGRTLVAAPIFGAVVGAITALRQGGSRDLVDEWLPRICTGEAVVTLATDESSHFTPVAKTTILRNQTPGLRLNGAKMMVHDGMVADLLIVTASGQNGEPVLCAIEANATGVYRTRREVFDLRDYADFEFTNVEVIETLGGLKLTERVLDVAASASAAEGLGVAVQAFLTTLDYLKTRQQFGRPIGSFQALQHRAARLYAEIELARPTIDSAMLALDSNDSRSPALVSLAKATTNRVMNLVTREMIQLHGGIAMTDQHDAGLYLKRARVLEGAFGATPYHKKRFGSLNGY